MQVAALHSSRVVLGGRPLPRRSHAAVKPGARFKGAVAFKEEEKPKQPPSYQEGMFRVVSDKEAAVQESTYAAPPDTVYKVSSPALQSIPAFTRRREHLVGRVAMVGVAAAWVGEVLTGLGPMTQLSRELHVPGYWALWATIGLAVGHLLLGLNTGSATYSQANRQDLARRCCGLTGNTAIEPDTDRKVQSLGQFFLRSELTLGRAAMLMFAGMMLMEVVWGGQSPQAHMGLIMPGVPLSEAPGLLKFFIGLFALGGLGLFSLNNANQDVETY